MKIVIDYEKAQGRIPKEVHKTGVGFDILSTEPSGLNERHIEVKTSSELWTTCTWIPLYKNEAETLKKSPQNFYLYFVKFDMDPKNRNEKTLNAANYDLYIINGQVLLNDFNLAPETYCLSPISKKKLNDYKQ